jgi:tRNA C32,U32 (ribose-2'-O)-methylase TrmJ
MNSSSNDALSPAEIVRTIDAALSDLEREIPGISADQRLRAELEAGLRAAVRSLEHSEIETRRAMEKMVFEHGDDSSVSATMREWEARGAFSDEEVRTMMMMDGVFG